MSQLNVLEIYIEVWLRRVFRQHNLRQFKHLSTADRKSLVKFVQGVVDGRNVASKQKSLIFYFTHSGKHMVYAYDIHITFFA